MRRPATKPTPESLTAGRNARGEICLDNGKGALIALAEHSRYQIAEWFETSRPGRFREQYRAALALLDREAAAQRAQGGKR